MAPSTVTLPSGASMPLTGLGLWKIPPSAAADAVYTAIKLGYRLLDGAADYANERECGQGVARAIAEGIVKREDLFIVSKLWNTNHAAEHVEPALRKSLKDWGLEYFDLYLIHMPIPLEYVDPAVRANPGWTTTGVDLFTPGSVIRTERSPLHLTWGAMEACHALELVKDIGISNFVGALIIDLMCYAKVQPAVLQVEMHPFHAQNGILGVCKAYGIRPMAFSSFGPASWVELGHPATNVLPSLLTLPEITKIADAHGVTPAQVLLRWETQRGIIVIPKSTSEARLKENLANTEFDLKEDEIAAISALDRGYRIAGGIEPHIDIYA